VWSVCMDRHGAFMHPTFYLEKDAVCRGYVLWLTPSEFVMMLEQDPNIPEHSELGTLTGDFFMEGGYTVGGGAVSTLPLSCVTTHLRRPLLLRTLPATYAQPGTEKGRVLYPAQKEGVYAPVIVPNSFPPESPSTPHHSRNRGLLPDRGVFGGYTVMSGVCRIEGAGLGQALALLHTHSSYRMAVMNRLSHLPINRVVTEGNKVLLGYDAPTDSFLDPAQYEPIPF
jgi:hypothetical protein